MSRYGRLWEDVRAIRERLKKSGIDASSLSTARAGVNALSGLVAEWEALEKQMAREPD